MRRIAFSLLLLGPIVTTGGPPIAATTPATCASVVARFVHDEAVIYREAGSPPIHCVVAIKDNRSPSGIYNGAERGIEIARPHDDSLHVGRLPLPRYALRVLAHEMGHAWADGQNFDDDYTVYGAIRGFPVGTDHGTLSEDYAETFAYAHGWWHRDPTPHAPYNFLAGAGKPTAAQIAALRVVGLLPAA